MPDTLVMFSERGDSLCVDIIEPDHKPWQLYFTDSCSLAEVLVDAADNEELSYESVEAVLRDSLPVIVSFHERRLIEQRVRQWENLSEHGAARSCPQEPVYPPTATEHGSASAGLLPSPWSVIYVLGFLAACWSFGWAVSVVGGWW